MMNTKYKKKPEYLVVDDSEFANALSRTAEMLRAEDRELAMSINEDKNLSEEEKEQMRKTFCL